MYLKYCTYNGWSKPYCFKILAFAESDKGISTGSKGPPGIACIKTKTKIEIKKKVKTIDNILFIIYLIIYTTCASTK